MRAALLILLAAADPTAAGQFSLSGSQRTRLEWINGQVRPGFARNDAILALRTVVRADYEVGPLSLTAELRDSRVLFQRDRSAVSANDVNALEPVVLQANLTLGDTLGAGTDLTLSFGRMTAALGSSRLVDSPEFRNTTNGYTGVRIGFRQGRAALDLLWALPQQRRPDELPAVRDNRAALDFEGFDRQVWGADLFIEQALGSSSLGVTYVGYAERDRPGRPTRDRRLHTLGPRLLVEPASGRFDLEAEALLQWGSVRDGFAPDADRLDALAGFARIEIGHSFEGPWSPRLSFRYDWVSGDRPGGRFTRFDRLFGNRIPDFGPSGIYAVIGRQNISAPGFRLAARNGGTEAYVTGRLLWADSATDGFSTSGVRDPTGTSGRFAGAHVEGRARHWLIRDRLRAEANFALLFRDGLLRSAPNAPPGRTTLYMAPALVASF